MGTSEVAVEGVLPALLSAIEEQPPYAGFLCSRDNEAVLALAVSYWSWPMLALQIAFSEALRALPTLQLPAWAQSWQQAGCSPCLSPPGPASWTSWH